MTASQSHLAQLVGSIIISHAIIDNAEIADDNGELEAFFRFQCEFAISTKNSI
jgi:hypothetical protein